jgi:hypothetical protein
LQLCECQRPKGTSIFTGDLFQQVLRWYKLFANFYTLLLLLLLLLLVVVVVVTILQAVLLEVGYLLFVVSSVFRFRGLEIMKAEDRTVEAELNRMMILKLFFKDRIELYQATAVWRVFLKLGLPDLLDRLRISFFSSSNFSFSKLNILSTVISKNLIFSMFCFKHFQCLFFCYIEELRFVSQKM